MKTLVRTWLMLGVCSQLGSCGSERSSTCDAMCEALSDCRMLPSVLGADDSLSGDNDPGAAERAERNCEKRCEVSDEGTYKAMKACVCEAMETGSESDATATGVECEVTEIGSVTDWCSAGFCHDLAMCVRDVFEDDRIAGVGPTELSLTLSEVPKAATDGGLVCGNLDDGVAGGRTGSSQEAKDWCTLAKAEAVTLALETDFQSIEIASSVTCVEALLGLHREDETLVGLYRAVARLQIDGGCRTIYGERVMITAGPSCDDWDGLDCKGEIPLPKLGMDGMDGMDLDVMSMAPGCEADAVACSNNADDDADDMVDCADPSCEPYCSS